MSLDTGLRGPSPGVALASNSVLYESTQSGITWRTRLLEWGQAPGIAMVELTKHGKHGLLAEWLLRWEGASKSWRGRSIAPKYPLALLSDLLVAHQKTGKALAKPMMLLRFSTSLLGSDLMLQIAKPMLCRKNLG